MKIKLRILCTWSLILALKSQADVGELQITLKVANDSGIPVAGATVGVSCVQSKAPLAVITAQNVGQKQIDVVTDTNGLGVIRVPDVVDQHIWYGINPLPGYYYTSGGELKLERVRNGQWQPWNQTVDVVLKPIGVGVPMYAKKVSWKTSIPENNKPIGYDLEIGDWVAPYGKGITSDLMFTLERHFTSVTQDFNATLKLTFPNDGDGIQSVRSDSSGSALRIPRLAPENGYESKLVLQMYREGGKPIVGVLADTDQNYFFRVRTKRDDRGNIVSVRYGKIQGGIGWDIFHSPTAQIQFTYYLNSKPNSRNTEFDPQGNQFKNLPPLERATAP